ncbi:hypothetical protein [Aquihabitans sp. McL0605]|uniref:hypothetical protein n=1 Tax=Aquihabitans sp. McL0605 TaxID=3415671 RepID=UPI003CF00DB9
MPQPAPPAAYPPAAAAPAGKPKGAAGIWIGVVLVIVGIVLGVTLVVSGARALVDGFDGLQRVPLSGGTVHLDDTGTKSIFLERPTSESGPSFTTSTSGGFVPNVLVTIVGPDGTHVNVDRAPGSQTYVYNGHEGVRIATFYAATPGTYTIQAIEGGQTGAYTSFAIGGGLRLNGLARIVGGIFAGGALVLIGIILIIVFAVKRSRSKRRLSAPPLPYPGGYGAAPAAWAGAPGAPVGAYPGAPGSPAPGYPAAPGYPPAGGYPPAPPAQPGYGAPQPGTAWTPPPAPGWVPPPAAPGSPPPPPAAPMPGQPWVPPTAPDATPGAAPPPPDAPPPPAAPPAPAPAEGEPTEGPPS